MKFLEAAKKDCIDHVRMTTGMLMDSPCGSGGNTNTGPLADRFFSHGNHKNISSLILNQEDRENYETLLSLNIMISVTQSVKESRKVHIDQIKALGIKLMLHLNTNLSEFIVLRDNSHQLLLDGIDAGNVLCSKASDP